MNKFKVIILTVCLSLVILKVNAQKPLSIQLSDSTRQRLTVSLPNNRAQAVPSGPYQATWESLKENYLVPEWLKDAKFGIFIHFGVYTVPAHGSEWYPHHMYNNESFAKWHIEHYGPLDVFGYKDFIPLFKAEKFNADEWTELFVKSGARYICPTAEHHDGFAMYDSKLTDWNAKKMGPKKDIIGLLAKSAHKKGLKFGISNHRMENWDFLYPTIKEKTDLFDSRYASFYGPPQPTVDSKMQKSIIGNEMIANPPALQSPAFLEEWLARMQEIVDSYKPDMVFFDNGINPRQLDPIKLRFAAYYYNRAAKWGKQVTITTKSDAYQYGTVTDYERQGRAPKKITGYYWQVDDPIADKFGYVEGMKVVSAASVVRKLVDNVSRNGNLMLNISPKSDGSIPEEQRTVLLDIGKWLKINGDAIYSTRACPGLPEGDFRFTTKNKILYAITFKWPKENTIVMKIPQSNIGKLKRISMLGNTEELAFTQDSEGLKIIFPQEKPCDYAYTLKLEN